MSLENQLLNVAEQRFAEFKYSISAHSNDTRDDSIHVYMMLSQLTEFAQFNENYLSDEIKDKLLDIEKQSTKLFSSLRNDN